MHETPQSACMLDYNNLLLIHNIICIWFMDDKIYVWCTINTICIQCNDTSLHFMQFHSMHDETIHIECTILQSVLNAESALNADCCGCTKNRHIFIYKHIKTMCISWIHIFFCINSEFQKWKMNRSSPANNTHIYKNRQTKTVSLHSPLSLSPPLSLPSPLSIYIIDWNCWNNCNA